MKSLVLLFLSLSVSVLLNSCYEGNESLDLNSENTVDQDAVPCNDFECNDNTKLYLSHPAFDVFRDSSGGNITIAKVADNIIITTNAMPNHVSPYWTDTHQNYISPADDGVITDLQYLDANDAKIDGFTGSFQLTVPECPSLADALTLPDKGYIGIAISGALIHTDSLNNIQTSIFINNSLDANGGRTLGNGYHYFFEPLHLTDNDDALVGIMADGFFIYGRNHNDVTLNSTLDCTNGHIHATEHSNGEDIYHYHINETVNAATGKYNIFTTRFGGTPSTIEAL